MEPTDNKSHLISGIITLRGNTPEGALVTAYDQDMRSRQLLGEAIVREDGKFEIQYAPEQFRRAEKLYADLKVIAVKETETAIWRAESEIIFQAPPVLTIQLILLREDKPQVKMTEYENLHQELQPLVEEVPFAELTEEDMGFLFREITTPPRRSRVVIPWSREQILFFKRSFLWNRETSIVPEAFYGWQRLIPGIEALPSLLARNEAELLGILAKAVETLIIPQINLEGVKRGLRDERLKQGNLARHTFTGILWNEKDKVTLSNYRVEVENRNLETPERIGTFTGTRDGSISFDFLLPPKAVDAQDYIAKLGFKLFDKEAKEIGNATLNFPPEENITRQINFDLQESTYRTPKVDELDLPGNTRERLKGMRINDLSDLRRQGGPRKIADLNLGEAEISRLEAHVNLSVLSPDIKVHNILIEKGFDNPGTIAKTTRADFVGTIGAAPEIGIVDAARLYYGAVAVNKALDNVAMGYQIAKGNGRPVHPGIDDIIGEIDAEEPDREDCVCEDCESAVSPGAYLADLLGYATKVIKYGNPPETLTLTWLEEKLFQRFGALPASCSQSEEMVNQVRICCEVLRGLLTPPPPDPPAGGNILVAIGHGAVGPVDNDLDNLFARTQGYRIPAYKELLAQHGITYNELKETILFGDTEARRLISEKAGIRYDPETPVNNIDSLYRDTNLEAGTITEPWLEAVFGLKSTLNDPLERVGTPAIVNWRLDYLQEVWQKADFPENPYLDGLLPVIDPDFIGLDDLRNPAGGAIAEIWIARKEALDEAFNRLNNLYQQEGGLQLVLQDVFGSAAPDFDAYFEGFNETFATAFPTVVADLKTRVVELAGIIGDAGILDEEQQRDFINALVSIVKISDLYPVWRPEEGAAWLSPMYFWKPKTEPEAGAWPPTFSEGTPIIDPQKYGLKDLLEPVAGREAHRLWNERKVQLDADYLIIKANREFGENGFMTMLQGVFGGGVSSESFNELLNRLNSNDPAESAAAEEALGVLRLTREDFGYLMTLKSRSESTIASRQPNTQEWEKLYQIVLKANKELHRYPDWMDEEVARELNVYWRVLKPKLPKFRASTNERTTWQMGLQMVSEYQPVVDPGIIWRNNTKSSNSNDIENVLWRNRSDALDARKDLLGNAVNNNNNLVYLNSLLTEGETALGLNHEGLLQLETERNSGNNIGYRLEQLSLNNPSFNLLLKSIHKFNDGYELPQAEWSILLGIIQRVDKKRMLALYRHEEKTEGVFLDPNRFSAATRPPVTDAYLQQLQRDWFDKLEGRIEQIVTVFRNNREAVKLAEERTLPLLRDALIYASHAQGRNLIEKREWIKRYLLIDAAMEGCARTTRISQAIETIQALLWGIRINQFQDEADALYLDTDHFDEEWVWMGAYASWRAAIFTWMYPENLLLGQYRKEQTPAFRELVGNLSNRITPEQACKEAQKYSEYFEDVFNHLVVEASCNAVTTLAAEDKCGGENTRKSILHIFGRSKATHKIYWLTVPAQITDKFELSYWIELKNLSKAHSILGAVPYLGNLFLFYKEHKTNKLLYSTLNLENPYNWTEPTELAYPEGAGQKPTVLVVQRSSDNDPPTLIIPKGNSSDIWYQKITIQTSEESQNIGEDDDEEDEFDNGWKSQYLELHIHQPGPYGSIEAVLEYTKAVFKIYTIRGSNYLFIGRDDHFESYYYFVVDSDLAIGNSYENDYWVSPFQENLEFGGVLFVRSEVLMVSNYEWPNINQAFIPAYGFYADSFVPRRYLMPSEDINFWGKLSNHNDDNPASSQNNLAFLIFKQRGGGYYISILEKNEEGVLSVDQIEKELISPYRNFSSSTFTIPNKIVRNSARSNRIRNLNALVSNEGYNDVFHTYLEEAYFFIPIFIAQQLQKSGEYLAALDWYRTVYDYSYNIPSWERIISPLLLNEGVKGNEPKFNRQNNWLNDPLDPHFIAETRGYSYIQYVQLEIIKCLIKYANAEFSKDTSETVPKARELYGMALELLNDGVLGSTDNKCEGVIGSLEIEVADEWKPAMEEVFGAIDWSKLNIRLLTEVSDTINNDLLTRDLDEAGKYYLLKSIKNRNNTTGVVPTISEKIDRNEGRRQKIKNALLTDTATVKTIDFVLNNSNITLNKNLVSALGSSPGLPADNEQDFSFLTAPSFVARDNSRFLNTSFVSPIPPARNNTNGAESTSPGVGLAMPKDQLYPSVSYAFCIPPNPVIAALKLETEVNLQKIRQCRNYAGLKRELSPYAAPTDTVSGLPIAGESGIILPNTFNLRPSQYRYIILKQRAIELVQIALQMENAMLAALEKKDAEAYQLLKTRQEIRLAQATIQLQDRRLTEVESNARLVDLQKEKITFQKEHFIELIEQGYLSQEQVFLDKLTDIRNLQASAAAFQFFEALRGLAAAMAGSPAGVSALVGGLTGGLGATANALSAEISELQFKANFARQKQDWEFQRDLSDKEIAIIDQQMQIVNNQKAIVEQERNIAVLHATNAQDTLEFLQNKFTNEELYAFMSNILESAFSFFLYQATSIAKLAQVQLAFENQEIPPSVIQDDYWEAPSNQTTLALQTSGGPDYKGLTGSSRLLQDIYKLDQVAFDTKKRKLRINKTISLAQRFPVEFQQFKSTGVLTFPTAMQDFDRDFPGHYFRRIVKVNLGVIALIPPNEGIKATLTHAGTSRVVIGGNGLFQTIMQNLEPQELIFSGNDTAENYYLELRQENELLLPFEGFGVDGTWEIRMPKPSNRFDYRTIADIIFSIEYSALSDYTYRQQVIQQLGTSVSESIAFSFRQNFADQWYDLNNPNLAAEAMRVRFRTTAADFPAGLRDISAQHLILYFVRSEGAAFEIPVSGFYFSEAGGIGRLGGPAQTIDGIISTERGNAGSWVVMLGRSPYGEWELDLRGSLTDGRLISDLFVNNEIIDILLVVKYRGETAGWPG